MRFSLPLALLLATGLAASAATPNAKAFLGRWDFNVTPATGKPYPQWMELKEEAGKITGRVQPRGGGWVNIQSASIDDAGKLTVNIAAATQRNPALRWELTSPGKDQLTGIEMRGDKEGPKLAGVKAPKLDRKTPKAWTEPRAIFNGKDLTGWEPIGNVNNSKWVARDGELVNDNPDPPAGTPRGPGAANIKTTEKFQDFKLHIEVLCPDHGNSGIYLRGRYEVQVGTEGGKLPDHEMGAIYSHYPPPANDLNLGKWTSFDITLVGRHVTVVRDGKTYHSNVEIPGPTGGALDSNEAEPGPFFLQGDHHGVIRYRNITVQVPKK
ncbi:large multifunctional protein- glycosyl hydrolase [Bryobacterales bacterium F-183]|nr:large multifunctional protein- glycosyl hydrolase [Bryobacterales bacterium F-183]